MKPEPTMSAQEEAMWKANITGSRLIDKQQAVKRSRLWTLDELRERFDAYIVIDPRGGPPWAAPPGVLEFLDWLEAEGGRHEDR